MGNTPKPIAKVVHLPPKKPRPPTEEFDTRSGEKIVRNTDSIPVDVTDPDGPPTDEMEIPIPLTELASVPTASMLDPFSLLEVVTFEAQAIIRNERESRGPKYFEILSGYAHMRSANDKGQPKDNPRDLGPGDFIGLIGFARVVSKTELKVRVYDLPKIAAMNNPPLHIAAQGRLFAAAADQATTYGREYAKLRERHAELEQVLQGRLDEIRERFIRPLKEELAEKNAAIARLEKDEVAYLDSLKASLAEIAQATEHELTDEREKRFGQLVAMMMPAIDAMLASDDEKLKPRAVKLLDLLYSFMQMNAPKAFFSKKPAT